MLSDGWSLVVGMGAAFFGAGAGYIVLTLRSRDLRRAIRRDYAELNHALASHRYEPPPAPCAHPGVRFLAATVTEPLADGVNCTIGVVAHCDACGKSWAGDMRAGMGRSPYRGG